MSKPNIDFSRGTDFKPKINHKIVRIFYFGGAIFIIVPIILYFVIGPEALPALLAMGGFALLIIFLIWLQASGVTIRYHLNPEGVYLRRSWFKRYYPMEEIVSIKKIPEETALALVNSINDDRVEAHNRIDPALEFSSRMDMGQLIAFSSIQFVGSDTSGTDRGVGGAVIYKSKMKTKGDFLLLHAKNGDVRLFTPGDMTGFMREFERLQKK